MTRFYKWGMTLVLILCMCAVPITWFLLRPEETAKLIPVVVVDKIVNPANPGLLLTQLDGGNGKNAHPKKVFKKDIRPAEYIVVANDPNGVEYNIRTDRVSFTTIKLLDTLWTIK